MRWLMLGLFMMHLLLSTASADPAGANAGDFVEPLFDLSAIANDPLEVEVESETTADGVLSRWLHFTAFTTSDGNGQPAPVRVRALLMMPAEGADLPGLLWCQGGMAPANPAIPGIYARKGYACIAITIPLDKAVSWGAWNAADPMAGNLTRYAVMQMRAVTVLCQEPRVDAQRLGVAGASYGGFYATLVAGADPRMKAGVSFFTGGHHDLGTNLPQFTQMPDQAAVEVWMRTLDPAWRHEQRDVPFMWTLPTNDNWFYFPAVVETYARARTAHKALAIVPYWTHGFPPQVDQQIFDWLDIYLKRTRQPYIQPSALQITQTAEGLRASWSSDGAPIAHAELVVSPNAPGPGESPWLGQWVHRLHQPFAAQLSEDRRHASALIPVLDSSRPLLVYGNVTDAQDVVTSTLPVLLTPPFPAASPRGQWNGCPWGEMEAQDVAQLIGMAQPPGQADDTTAHRGTGSSRVDPPTAGNPARKPRKKAYVIKLFHVPHLAHQLTLALRTRTAARVQVTVQALPPANWTRPAVQAVMGTQPPALTQPKPVSERVIELTEQWQVVQLDVPAPTAALEGYNLQLELLEPADAVWWYDSVEFTPVVE